VPSGAGEEWKSLHRVPGKRLRDGERTRPFRVRRVSVSPEHKIANRVPGRGKGLGEIGCCTIQRAINVRNDSKPAGVANVFATARVVSSATRYGREVTANGNHPSRTVIRRSFRKRSKQSSFLRQFYVRPWTDVVKVDRCLACRIRSPLTRLDLDEPPTRT